MAVINANELKDFRLDLSDREIYNDIRAECDVTEILTVRPDATPDLFTQFDLSVRPAEGSLAAGATEEVTETAPAENSEIQWLDITGWTASPVTLIGWPQSTCEALDGYWRYSSSLGVSLCSLPTSLAKITAEIVGRTDTTVTVKIENTGDYAVRCTVHVAYLALSPESRYIKLRSINQASIDKYGRRAMDLKWPLGITPVMMQSLIDNYCTRYCEPVSMASMTLEGETDAKITQILGMEIEDKHQIIHAGLSMDQVFFVNSINASFNRAGSALLTGTFGLEQQRASETATLFTLDTSLLDGAHVLG